VIDADGGVRLAAVRNLIGRALEYPQSIDGEILKLVGGRLVDRRDDVRLAAIDGLGRVFGQWVCSAVPSLASVATMRVKQLSDTVDGDMFSRLQSIPTQLMKSWGRPCPDTRYLILTLLQEHLSPCLPEKSKDYRNVSNSSPSSDSQDSGAQGADSVDDRRAAAMLLLFECLSADDRTTLGAIMKFKATACRELQGVLDLQASMRASTTGRKRVSRKDPQVAPDTKEQRSRLQEALLKLMVCLPGKDQEERVQELLAAEDKVYHQLQTCASPTDTALESLSHRAELKEYLHENSMLAQCTTEIWATAGYLLVNEGIVQSLLTFAVSQSGVLAAESAELLCMIAGYAPQCFQNSTQDLLRLLTTCSAGERDTSKQRQMKETILSSCTSMV